MDTTRSSEKQLILNLFHQIGETAQLVEEILPNSNTPEQKSRLQYIETKLRQSQRKIVTEIIHELVTKQQVKQTEEQLEFGLSQAVDLIEAIEREARQRKLAVVIAVYNSAANPIAVHCMDHAYIASYDIAVNKAFTSAALKMSTMTLKGLSQPGQELYGIQHTNQGKIVIFGGGEPLYYKNKLVGAIGVSGGTEYEDTSLAEYGKDILEEVMKW